MSGLRLKPESDWALFFAQSPFRSAHFLVITCLVISCIALGCLVVVRNLDRLTTGEVLYLSVVVGGGILSAWHAAFRIHEDIHDFYRSGTIVKPDPDSPQEMILIAAAKGLVQIMYLTFIVILFLLLGFALFARVSS